MNMEHVAYSEPKCWPENDIYFKAGVSFLQERLNADGIQHTYSFLHLNGYTLKDFLSDFSADKHDRIVLISSPRLLPLAKFWMANHHNVCAVFDSSINIENLAKMLKTIPSPKGNSNVIESFPEITDKDIIILRHYLTSGSMDFIQCRYSRSYGTVQQWKINLARKFSVRKLEYLTLQR